MSDDILSKYMPSRRSENGKADSSDTRGANTPAPSHVTMLDLELPGGNRAAYPYATLMKIEFDPSSGITLKFSTEDVRITGHHLEELYKGLAQHRVPRVRVTGDRKGFIDAGSSEPVVTGIRCGPAPKNTR